MSKRIFDFVGAYVLLVFIALFVPFIAMWIKATSPGPVIFRQVRAGYRGKPFTIFKFRTMKDGTGRSFDLVRPGDSRVTVPGRFLRKTHMDELPQLINVLLGQMSLVGPRPVRVELVEKHAQEIPTFARRLDVRPGLTGLGQIHGRIWSLKRGIRCVLRLYLFYINHCCFLFDLYILFRTLKTIIGRKGV